jgi:hypothetical protein
MLSTNYSTEHNHVKSGKQFPIGQSFITRNFVLGYLFHWVNDKSNLILAVVCKGWGNTEI